MTELLDSQHTIVYGAGGRADLASDRAGAITGTLVNATCGLVL